MNGLLDTSTTQALSAHLIMQDPLQGAYAVLLSYCCRCGLLAAMEKQGSECAPRNFWVLDKDGLITEERSNLPDYVSRFARPVGADESRDGAGLLEVVKAVKPTVLLGLAGAHHKILVLINMCLLSEATPCTC
jgi:hypothetical protein